MKQNNYEIEKNIEKVLRGYSTGFLTLNIANEIKNRLKKVNIRFFLLMKILIKSSYLTKKNLMLNYIELTAMKKIK